MKIIFQKSIFLIKIYTCPSIFEQNGRIFKSNGIEVQLVASALIQIASPKRTGNGTTCLNRQVIDN